MKDLIDLLKTIFHDKAVAWLVLGGLAIPTVWVVYKFFVEGIQNATQKYYDLKLDLYKEIVKITATIATSKNKEEIDTAGQDYGANERDQFDPNSGGPAVKQQPVTVAPKIGRNDPCPCGSGKKYKQCHGKDA